MLQGLQNYNYMMPCQQSRRFIFVTVTLSRAAAPLSLNERQNETLNTALAVADFRLPQRQNYAIEDPCPQSLNKITIHRCAADKRTVSRGCASKFRDELMMKDKQIFRDQFYAFSVVRTQ